MIDLLTFQTVFANRLWQFVRDSVRLMPALTAVLDTQKLSHFACEWTIVAVKREETASSKIAIKSAILQKGDRAERRPPPKSWICILDSGTTTTAARNTVVYLTALRRQELCRPRLDPG